jgi:putative ABC transport system permease protein
MFVALLAVATGATILSGLMMIYYDIPRQMGQEFRSYGANLVIVPAGDAVSISPEAVRRAAAFLPEGDVVGIAPYRYHRVKINEQPFMAAGTDFAQVKKVSPYWFVSGGWPESPGEAIIGQEVAAIIRLAPGDSFTLAGTDAKGKPFERRLSVRGLVRTGGAEEAFIFMSLPEFEDMTGEAGKIDFAECSVSASAEALEDITARIGKNVPGAQARVVKRVSESEGVVLTKLQALVWLVTVVVLLLIMICVATTMMAVVAERRGEIGLRKALGAANRSIVTEFLGEGIFLGGAGGLLGAIFGFVFAYEVSINVFSRMVTFQPILVPVTVAASVLVTATACFLPVRSATEVDPAIVLRGE